MKSTLYFAKKTINRTVPFSVLFFFLSKMLNSINIYKKAIKPINLFVLVCVFLMALAMIINLYYGIAVVLFIAALYIFWAKPIYGLILLIVVMSNFAGFLTTASIPSIKGSFGSITILDILFVLSIIPLLRNFYLKKIQSLRSPLSMPVILLLVLVVFQIIRAFFLQHEDIHYILRLSRPFLYYALFFVFLASIKSKNDLTLILKTFIIIGLIVAVGSILQFFTGWTLEGVKLDVLDRYDYYRVTTFGLMFPIFGFFILLTTRPFLAKTRGIFFISYFISTIIFIFTSYSRGLWVIFFFNYILYFIIELSNIKTTFKRIIVLSIISFSLYYFAIGTLTMASNRILSFIDMIRQQTGSFQKRSEVFRMNIDYAINDNILLGVGFKFGESRYGKDEGLIIEQHRLLSTDPYSYMGVDMGLIYIFFRYGLIGAIIYIFIFYRAFKTYLYLLKNLKEKYYNGIIKGCLLINVFSIPLGLISQPFTEPAMLIVMIISWFMIGYIYRDLTTSLK